MTTHKEALTLALECAERCESIDGMYSWTDTVTAIKEVLAQPAVPQGHKQEPVAWMQPDKEHISLWKDDYHTIPLYTTPPYVPTDFKE